MPRVPTCEDHPEDSETNDSDKMTTDEEESSDEDQNETTGASRVGQGRIPPAENGQRVIAVRNSSGTSSVSKPVPEKKDTWLQEFIYKAVKCK